MRFTVMASAIAAAAVFLSAESAQALEGQDFEGYPNGATTAALLDDDPAFGYFYGGTVQQPGVTVDAAYALAGERVYYGTALGYTNMLPGPSHDSAYFRMEMLISAPNGVLVEILGHEDPACCGPGFWNEIVQFQTILTGTDLYFVWGSDIDYGQEEIGQTSDITRIRWTSVDGTPISIDNVGGIGMAAIPEPESWAMLIAGFGLAGCAMRRRRMPRPE